MKETKCILREAKAAVSSLAVLKSEEKNKALLAMADALIADTSSILCENKKDMDAAKDTISSVMLDRLKLDESRIRAMADGIRAVAALPDPVGRILSDETRPNGLHIQKVSVPMGVIAIIYESRPNVTSDAAALALKSGNVCVLRTGKEAFHSAFSIVNALKKGLHSCGINEQVINLIEDTSRKSALDLMRAVGFIDLLIPRGGAGLIKACVEQALVPCIQTGTGICHIYVDKDADLSMALRIVENAKMSVLLCAMLPRFVLCTVMWQRNFFLCCKKACVTHLANILLSFSLIKKLFQLLMVLLQMRMILIRNFSIIFSLCMS